VEVIARGLEVPWALAFAPDGRLFVTERPGRVRIVAGGHVLVDPVATLNVAAIGEGGLMGLALDPAFGQTGYLYVCYTLSSREALVNRIVRLTVRDDVASSERVILDGLPGASIHDGCRLKFGPDGKLYATTGDAAHPPFAQQRDSLAGKILRLNPDGTIPDDNPFPGSPVYSLGHRNPQGLAWSGEGRLFAAEHGSSAHDEINEIRPGANYGWPEVRGRAGDPRFVDPVVESGTETWAPSGIAFLGDDLFVAALRGRRLLRVTGTRQGEPRVSTALSGWGRLREVVAGPDGLLYVTTSSRDGRGFPAPDDDRILRLRP
jgi:glucose/arabinose dehydrogenase